MDLKLRHKENYLKYALRINKKILNAGLRFSNLQKICFNEINLTDNPDLTPSIFKFENDLINGIYSAKYNPLFLPADLFEFNYFNLISGVGMGFGLPDDLTDNSRINSAKAYKKNVAFFSGAKTFQHTLDLSNNVFNPNGTKRSFKEFKEIALNIDNNYNKNWLKTELNAAFRVAQSGEAWHEIQEDKDIFPYLKYVTVGDERVRHSHAALDGIIKPVNSPFWNENMPPNDWGCRCIVIQLTEGEETNLKKHLEKYNKSVPKKKRVKTLKNQSKVFANNPGKSGVIFPKTGHPYTDDIPAEFKTAERENFGFETPSDNETKKFINKNFK